MPAPEDDRFLSVQEIKAAAAHGHLPLLTERLARERSWLALASLFEQVVSLPIALPVLTETVRRCTLALRGSPERRRDRMGTLEDIRTVRLLAAEALLSRVAGGALTEADRLALSAGASALADGGDLQRAATTFEQAHDWAAAAEVWGRMGELERMEACLGKDEDRHRTRRAAIGAVRDIEALVAAGERLAAFRLAERVPEGLPESAAARQMALSLGAQLIRSRNVTLRTSGDSKYGDTAPRTIIFAATPATLGRDPLAEVPLRDPGVSRRHALLAMVGEEPSLTDAGSRGGTFVGGARLSSPLSLRGAAEVSLGTNCRLELQVLAPARIAVRGLSGLDRDLLAMVGRDPLPLGEVIPEAAGAWMEFDAGGVHFCRPRELSVKIAGQLVSTRVDLLHGDTLEISGADTRIEVA
ncbi:MAG: FHA domain-containing protein [Myxococcales bacterium]